MRISKKIFVGIILLVLPFSLLLLTKSVKSSQTEDVDSVALERYTLQKGPIKINGPLKNFSGLTYSPFTESLFLVTNRPARVLELGLDGKRIRTINLHGFHDPEGITHIMENTFAVVEEEKGTFCTFEITPDTTSINREELRDAVLIAPRALRNKGLEGITYDPEQSLVYLVQEKSPRKLYQLPWPKKPHESPDISHPWDIQKNSFSLKDLAGIFYHPKSTHLLLLSDESSSVVETTLDGKEISRLSLMKGQPVGLLQDVPQAEGITMDSQGILYICSEPDFLYIFKKL